MSYFVLKMKDSEIKSRTPIFITCTQPKLKKIFFPKVIRLPIDVISLHMFWLRTLALGWQKNICSSLEQYELDTLLYNKTSRKLSKGGVEDIPLNKLIFNIANITRKTRTKNLKTKSSNIKWDAVINILLYVELNSTGNFFGYGVGSKFSEYIEILSRKHPRKKKRNSLNEIREELKQNLKQRIQRHKRHNALQFT